MDSTPSTSSATPTGANSAPQKPKIDPLQLLKCLSILLNPRGGIAGRAEVPRVRGLMTKYSKKLVSKCIYLNILQATDIPLLDMFYEEGGWGLVKVWLQVAVKGRNWPLATQVLTLMESSPVTLARLKCNSTPSLVKELSRDPTATGVQAVAKRLVQKWMEMLRNGDGSGVAAAAAGAAASATTALPTPPDTAPANTTNTQQDVGAASMMNTTNTTGTPQVHTNIPSVAERLVETQDVQGSTQPLATIPSSQQQQRDPRSSTQSPDDGSGGGVSGGGDNSSSQLSQDESSNTSTESEAAGPPSPVAPITPIRITIRSGSQVLAKVSSQRLSQDSTDSDDNKPLSVLLDEVRQVRKSERNSAAGKKSKQSAVTHIATTTGSTPTTVPQSVVTTTPSTSETPTTTSQQTSTQALSSPTSQQTSTQVLSPTSQPSPPSPSPTPTPTTTTTLVTPSTTTTTSSSTIPETSTPSTTTTTTTTPSASSLPSTTPNTTTTTVPNAIVTCTTGQPTTTNTTTSTPAQNGPLSPTESEKDTEGAEQGDSKEGSVVEGTVNGESESEKVREDTEKSDAPTDRDKVDGKRERDRKSKDSSKDKEKERDRKSRNSDSRRDKDRSRSSRDKDKGRERHSSDSKHRSSRDKDKDRRDKDRSKSSSSSSSKDKKSSSRDKDKEKEKRRRQESEDKATLEKVKPLSTDGLAKIPRRVAPPTFLDALGSADVDVQQAKKSTVKTYKSRGFRNTGLLDEPSLPPKKTEKKAGAPGTGMKRTSSLEEVVPGPPDKRVKSSVSSQPNLGDKPGGVKLISPKRPSLSDDGGFMAALTAAGSDTPRKKVTRKRKSSESDGTGKGEEKEGGGGKVPGEEGGKTGEEASQESDLSSPTHKTEDKLAPALSPTNKPVAILSPTSIKPTFNFYQETLKDEVEEEKEEEEEEEEEEGGEEEVVEKEEEEEVQEEVNEEGGDSKEEEVEMPQEEEKIDVDECEKEVKEEENEDSGDVRDEDIPHAPAVPAPAQEEYEHVEVTFSTPPCPSVRPSIVYHRPARRTKKSVKWCGEDDLHQIYYFELDETERVNVNTVKFNELMVMERQGERECMGRRLVGNFGGIGSMVGDMDDLRQTGEEYMRWTLLPVMQTGQPSVISGCRSQEKVTQATRQTSTMPAFFHPAMLPETPREPDPELITRLEPKEVPLLDVMGQDNIHDHRDKYWPEPILTDPTLNYSYGGGGGMGGGGSMGGMPGGPPGGGVGGQAGGASHWVIGGPPAAPPYVGPPIYAGPGGPGPGGPPGGGPGGYGGTPGPGSYGRDMGEMDGGPGWGGPGPDYHPGPMMGRGGGGMMMGHQGHHNMAPPNMMPNMGMGGGGPRFRNRGGGGGGWLPRGLPPPCRHYMYGHCRHGKACKYFHSKPH